MTVKQLLRSLDSRELSEWMAYFEIENEKYKDEKEEKLTDKIINAFPYAGGK